MFRPTIFGENLFEDWMNFSFPSDEKKSYVSNAQNVMRTDIRESEKGFELDIELPGYAKEEVKVQLKEGYLIVQAVKNVDNETKDEEGTYVRKERYCGSVSRSFYVGEDVVEEDIQAKFDNGILKLTVPKKDKKKEPETKYISID